MRFVYGVGFAEDGFLMIFNPRRQGWEMPGGHIEGGESPEEAIEREYMEESGYQFTPTARMDMGEVAVFAGIIVPRRRGEMRWEIFDRLPPDLAFPDVEYQEIVEWARRCVYGGKGEIGRTTKT